MRPRSSAIVWLTAVAVAVLPHAAQSQVVAPFQAGLPSPSEPEGQHVASTRELLKRLKRAKQLLAEQNYSESVRFLQAILENDEDAFFFPDEQDPTKERSLKLEAQTILGEMPSEGREIYEKQFGPAARRLFEEASRAHDTEGLAHVARRYFHTTWGYEAAYRLAADHLDHERAQTAALCFERLRSVGDGALRFEPYLSLKTALSWMQAGFDDRAVQVLVELKMRQPRKTLTLGGREVPIFDDSSRALAWLTAIAGGHRAAPPAGADEWLLVGGDSRRTASGAAGSPYLNRGWHSSTIDGSTPSQDSDALVERAFHDRRPPVPSGSDDSAVSPTLPGFLPLVVDDLVIVRSIGDVRAFELETGKLVWTTGEKDQLLLELLRSPATPQAQVPAAGPLALLVSSRAWEDATFATLSSDGEFVFAVEDLGMGLAGMMVVPRMAREYNRLVAYDVKTGRAMWEAGGARSAAPDALEGTYFLGAPLVLDRRLYVLGESGSDVRLFVLDPQNGRLDWSQTVNSAVVAGNNLYVRQQSGLSPSYFGEILVCPVGPDQVVALDLTRRSLAWRHKFQNAADLYDPRRQQLIIAQQQRLLAQQGGMWPIDQNRWLDALALIGDMKVVITPRDSNELFCLNLLDGSLAWRKPRGEGLFVAGIHQGKVLVVGRSYVQALNVADGEPAWPEPTSLPVPSGRGFVAGDTLHLPLVTGEVASISLRDGRVMARAHSLAGKVPGNLVSVRGSVVSQGPDFVEAFRPLDALENDIVKALAKNPADAEALALRGEIRLQHGMFGEAYADLKRALELKSDDADLRALLVGCLLEGLRVDFDSYRGLGQEIERLFTKPEERSSYLWLTAQGLKRAGEPRAALAALLRFGEPDVSDRELDRLDATLVVRRDRLVRSRAAELYAEAPPALRQEMEGDWQARLAAVREKKDLPAVWRFLRYFGALADARGLQRLAVQLPSPDGDWLDDEMRNDPLCTSRDEAVAAAATARMAQLLLAAERPRDALAYIRRLEQQFPETAALDGRSGRELAAEWLNKAEVGRELAVDGPWPAGRVEWERLPPVAANPVAQRSYEIPIAGDRGPMFNDTALYVSLNWKDFFARDGYGRQLWKVSLDAPLQQTVPIYNRAYVSGHFILISVGAQILAIDTLGTADQPGARLLWKLTLAPVGRPGIAVRAAGLNPRKRVMPFNQFGEQVGTIGPVTREHVALLTGHRLMALEPLTGKPLWMREGVAPGTELFGDEELLYAIPPDSAPMVVYSALDGTILANRPRPPERPRLDTFGRHIVTRQVQDARLVLALHDPWSGKDVWSRRFDDTAEVALVEFDEAAVLEPSGKFTVVSLADGSVRFTGETLPEPQLRQIHVIRSREQYVVIANQASGNTIPGAQWQQVIPQLIAVRGRTYAFDRATRARQWVHEIDLHGIDLHQPNNLPILTFVSCFNLPRPGAQGLESRFGLTCLDKRTGRVIFDDRKFDEHILFVDYSSDIDQKQIELRLFKSILRLSFTDTPLPE